MAAACKMLISGSDHSFEAGSLAFTLFKLELKLEKRLELQTGCELWEVLSFSS
jgi:hypothetical protein